MWILKMLIGINRILPSKREELSLFTIRLSIEILIRASIIAFGLEGPAKLRQILVVLCLIHLLASSPCVMKVGLVFHITIILIIFKIDLFV